MKWPNQREERIVKVGVKLEQSQGEIYFLHYCFTSIVVVDSS